MRRVLPPAEDMFLRLREDLKKGPPAGSKKVVAATVRGGRTLLEPLASETPLRHGRGTPPLSHSAEIVPPSPSDWHQARATSTGPWSTRPVPSPAAPVPLFVDDATVSRESQQQSLETWMRHYARELADADSSTLAAEVLLQHITDVAAPGAASSSSSSGTVRAAPHPLRVAAVCAIAENVCDVVGRYRNVLRPVLDELYRSVYMPQGTAAPREELVASRMVSLGLQPKESMHLQQFLARKPYFEAATESKKIIESLELQISLLSTTKSAGKSVLDRLGGTWRSSVTRLVFRAWRGAAQRSRTQNAIMNRFLTTIQRKDVIETHFYAWRLVVKQQQLSRAREQYAGSIEQLVQMEASTNARYLEVDDQLYECKMVVARLKVEKDLQKLEREQLQQAAEAALAQAEGWRRVTVDVITFLGTLKKYMATPKPMIGAQPFHVITETVLLTLLEWAGKTVGHLPQSSKLRLTNFGPDMKDGVLLILLVHVLTNGEVDLRVLQDVPDIPGRLQIVLDALQHPLGIVVPLAIDDICPPTPEMNFLLLYLLWSTFEAPPLPDNNTAMTLTSGYRDDLEATSKYIESARSFYPVWLERRHLLQQYASFVLLARIKQLPPAVLSAVEATEREKERDAFALANTAYVPSAFLSAANLSPSQKFQNEEERDRVNLAIGKHMGLVRHLFERYATKVSSMAASIRAAREAEHRKYFLASVKSKKMAPAAPDIPDAMRRDVLVEMDVMGFYRLCCDAGIVKQGIVPAPNARGRGDNGRGGGASRRKDNATTQILTEPRGFTKLSVFDMFADILMKFASTDRSDDATAAPPVFAALLVHLAVHRYGQPMTAAASQQIQPPPAGALVELLLTKDLASAVGVTSAPSFLTELLHDTVQNAVFLPRRKVLRLLFQRYCSVVGGDAAVVGVTTTPSMNSADFARFFRDVIPNPGLLHNDDQSESAESLAGTLSHDASMWMNPLFQETQLRTLFEDAVTCFLPEDAGESGAAASHTPSAASPISPSSPTAGSPMGASLSSVHPHMSPKAFLVGAPQLAELRMVYGEFEIALAAVAIQIVASPFIPLQTKLTSLIDGIVFASKVAQEVLADEE